MVPGMHFLVAGGLGSGVYLTTGSWEAGGATVVAGVLPDADHLLDYYNWFVLRRVRRLFYLLHGWEYLAAVLVVAAAMSWPPLLIGVAVGYASHILGDYLANDRNVLAYSLAYRALHGFRMRSAAQFYVRTQEVGALPEYRRASIRDVLRWALRRSLGIRRMTGASEAGQGCQCEVCTALAAGVDHHH